MQKFLSIFLPNDLRSPNSVQTHHERRRYLTFIFFEFIVFFTAFIILIYRYFIDHQGVLAILPNAFMCLSALIFLAILWFRKDIQYLDSLLVIVLALSAPYRFVIPGPDTTSTLGFIWTALMALMLKGNRWGVGFVIWSLPWIIGSCFFFDSSYSDKVMGFLVLVSYVAICTDQPGVLVPVHEFHLHCK